jgi:tRNA-specific adenosine deaminase 3
MYGKRRKIDSSSPVSDVTLHGEHEVLENWHLRPVLDDDVMSDCIQLLDIYVDRVTDTKHTSRLIQELNALWPIPSLQHLKRVSKSEVILDLAAEEDTPETCIRKLKDHGLDTAGLGCAPRRLRVPAVPPKTRRHYEEAIKLWPCNFHENKYLEKVLSGKLFDNADKLEQQKYMKKCLEAARRSFESGGAGVGAVVVDPAQKRIIAIGYDDRGKYPLKHAVMVVIDLVSHSQGGGAWNVGDEQYFYEGEGSRERKANVQDTVSDPVTLPRIEGVSRFEIVQKQNSGSVGLECESGKHSAVGGIDTHAKDTSKCSDSCGVIYSERVPRTSQYICTGYDVYVTREPCTMCAMALVHSRVRRVFYGCASPHGALGTNIKLNTLKCLNHHYEVFAGILEKECKCIETTWQKNLAIQV